MLCWPSSMHRRSSSSSGASKAWSLHRISLDLPEDQEQEQQQEQQELQQQQQQQRPSLLAPARSCTTTSSDAAERRRSGSAPSASGRANLRRRSLPAIHLQEDLSAAMMSNPPVFDNPLRRRGCCDHSHTQQMSQYRADAIQREQAIRAGSAACIPVEGTA